MISRRTIFSLLLALMILLCLRAWLIQHPDNCDRYMAGDRTVPSSVYIQVGRRTAEVPCEDWLLRKPPGVQAVCLLDAVVAVVFLLGVWGDIVRRNRNPRKELS